MNDLLKNRILLLVTAGLSVCLIAVAAPTTHNSINARHGTATPYAALTEDANQRPELPESVKLNVGDRTFSLAPGQLGWRLDTAKINEAAGRKALPVSNVLAVSIALPERNEPNEPSFFDKRRIPAYTRINDSVLRSRLSRLAEKTKKTPVNARIVEKEGSYVIRPAVPGSRIDMTEAFRSVRSTLAKGDAVVNIPVMKVAPKVTAPQLKHRLSVLKSRQAALARREAAPTPAPRIPRTCSDNPQGRKLILVSISSQHLWACSGPSTAYDVAITTGAYSNGTPTPTGSWYVYSKTANTRLIGPGWNYAVNYWMAFYSDYGFHDSSWQTFPYGSAQYSSQGSHGCVHVPAAAMSWLYGWASVGTAVTITA